MNGFTPYNGTEPYIFISYAHKDYSLVEQFLRLFSENRYRFWYDEGIKSGAEWSDYIVERIDKAEIFVVFLSSNSTASENVKDEIHVAVSSRKHVVVIKLDDTILSGGLLLKLDRKQAVNYTGNIESAFSKLTSINQINNCVEIPTSDIFITYPNYDEKAAYSTALTIETFLKRFKKDIHIDQRAKIENVLDFELENGRINEIQKYLRQWVEEQNTVKAHGCNTLIIVLTSTNMNGLGDSISTTREYYYEAKEKNKRVLFVLSNNFYIPSSNFIPNDIKEEVSLFGISMENLKDSLISKLNLPVISSRTLKKIPLSNVEFAAPESTLTLIEKSEDSVTINYGLPQAIGPFSYGITFWRFDTPIAVLQGQRAYFGVISEDSSVKSVRIEFKLINKYADERVIEKDYSLHAFKNDFSINLLEKNDTTEWFIQEICLVLTPLSLSENKESGMITIRGIELK